MQGLVSVKALIRNIAPLYSKGPWNQFRSLKILRWSYR